jgi:beta-1,4-mannooligosaccharide/beta-1,4-mannosyl-N-acetylglucosamine phosphorylase
MKSTSMTIFYKENAMPYTPLGSLKSSPVITRHPDNPVLTPDDVPYPCHLTFNAGITKYQGEYVMVFRNDVFDDPQSDHFKNLYSNLGLATSPDGINWTVKSEPCFTLDNIPGHRHLRPYDPRLTVIDGRVYMCFALDTFHGVRGGIAVTDDFESWEILTITAPENRNMVLFPEKVGGRYLRLERPFPMYGRGKDNWDCEHTRFDLWFSASPDLKYWGEHSLVMGVEHVPFANDKIGPAAPPIKTDKGWLTTFHAVDIDDSRGKNGWEQCWRKRYCGGIMLLDLDDPRKVIGLCEEPLIAPEAPYELTGGFRDNVIFPGGMILEDSGEVKIYYGAGDAFECLLTADVHDLINLCKPVDLGIH